MCGRATPGDPKMWGQVLQSTQSLVKINFIPTCLPKGTERRKGLLGKGHRSDRSLAPLFLQLALPSPGLHAAWGSRGGRGLPGPGQVSGGWLGEQQAGGGGRDADILRLPWQTIGALSPEHGAGELWSGRPRGQWGESSRSRAQRGPRYHGTTMCVHLCPPWPLSPAPGPQVSPGGNPVVPKVQGRPWPAVAAAGGGRGHRGPCRRAPRLPSQPCQGEPNAPRRADQSGSRTGSQIGGGWGARLLHPVLVSLSCRHCFA